MNKTYNIGGHTLEYRESSTGSCDPWSMDYANEHNINLIITADMAEFVLIDGDDIFKLNCAVAFPSALKEYLEKNNPTWLQFSDWFQNWVDRSFGSLKQSIAELKEMENAKAIKDGKPMTGAEYTKTLQQLRNKRDYHERMKTRYAAQMDELESNFQLAQVHCGEYVRYKWVNGDPSHHTDYTEYLHVDSVESTKRGFYLKGHGFVKTAHQIMHIDCIRCYWEDVDSGNITDITEEEYINELDSALATMRKEVIEKIDTRYCKY